MPKENSKNSPDIHRLLAAIRRNDELSLNTFYRKNYAKVERYILNNNGNSDESKDIYQEAFIAVWRNIQLNRFQPHDETSLDGYLYRVAKNKWIDQLRASKRVQVVPLTEDVNDVAADTAAVNEEQDYFLDRIKENLKLLGDNCRDVLERFYYKKESMRSISEAMKWTEATARNNKYRCIQRLRYLLQIKDKK